MAASPSFQQQAFPTLDEIASLARSIVNDTFPGLAGQQGRILTNDAPFMLPYFNSAFRWLQRKLRNEGASFPIIDNWILPNLPIANPFSPDVQTYVSFAGFFDGTTMHATPRLPSDCLQVLEVQERPTGTNLPFCPIYQPQGGLPSCFPYQCNGCWEWRQYRINLPGATQATDLRIRYQAGLPPLNIPAADFATTTVNILDCDDVIANHIAFMYATARGAQDTTQVKAARDEAFDDMANEWVRRSQGVSYSRQPYSGGYCGDYYSGYFLGQTGIIA